MGFNSTFKGLIKLYSIGEILLAGKSWRTQKKKYLSRSKFVYHIFRTKLTWNRILASSVKDRLRSAWGTVRSKRNTFVYMLVFWINLMLQRVILMWGTGVSMHPNTVIYVRNSPNQIPPPATLRSVLYITLPTPSTDTRSHKHIPQPLTW